MYVRTSMTMLTSVILVGLTTTVIATLGLIRARQQGSLRPCRQLAACQQPQQHPRRRGRLAS